MRRFMLPLLVFVLVLVIGAAGLLVWREYPWLLSKSYVLRVATPPAQRRRRQVDCSLQTRIGKRTPPCGG